jgi:hypothetical protein
LSSGVKGISEIEGDFGSIVGKLYDEVKAKASN